MFHAEIPRKPFLAILQSVVAFVAKGENTEAILKQARLSVKGDCLTIQGTNLENSIQSKLKGITAITEGDILLPCENALKIIKESQDEVITIKDSGNYSSIELDGAKFSLNTGELFKVEEFPQIKTSSGFSFKINSKRLEEMLGQVLYATAKEASRYTLNGVLFQIEDGKLTLVATDGKRLSLASEVIDFKSDPNKRMIGIDESLSITPFIEKIIIHEKSLRLVKSFAEKEETTTISWDTSTTWFDFGNTTVSCKLLEGRFPKFQEVIPKGISNSFLCNTKEFASKLKQSSIMTGKNKTVVKLQLSKSRLVLDVETTGIGKAEIALGVDYIGDELELGANPFYLMDALNAYNQENIKFSVKDKDTAIVMDDGNLLFLIMPVSLKS